MIFLWVLCLGEGSNELFRCCVWILNCFGILFDFFQVLGIFEGLGTRQYWRYLVVFVGKLELFDIYVALFRCLRIFNEFPVLANVITYKRVSKSLVWTRVTRCDYFQRTVRFFHQLSVVRFWIGFVRFFLKPSFYYWKIKTF